MVAENTAGPYREMLAREAEEVPRRRWATWRVVQWPNGLYELQRRRWSWPFWWVVESSWDLDGLKQKYIKLITPQPRIKEIDRW